RRRLPGQDEDRGAALGGLGQAGHRVGEPGALVHAADADTPGHASVAVGHADGAALMASLVEAGPALTEPVGDDQVAAAEHAEGIPNTLGGDGPAHDVGHRGIHRLSHQESHPTSDPSGASNVRAASHVHAWTVARPRCRAYLKHELLGRAYFGDTAGSWA